MIIFKRLIPTVCLLIMLTFNGESSATVREPAVAGSFYPGDSLSLDKVVRSHLKQASQADAIDGELIALIVPHAGLVYSGAVAAHSYKLLQDSPVESVILCGPAHRHGFEGISVYGPGIEWKTPLGIVKCDDKVCDQLLACDRQISVLEKAHRQEHCLEVQLPYLQTVLKDFRITPILMGYPDRATVDLLADALATLELSGPTVMVASTDWQHYRPASVGGKMDSLGIECLKQFDIARLERLLAEKKVEACGGGPMVAVLKAAVARGANRVKILKYADSGDISGDKSSVVGYLAAAIYKSKPGNEVNNEKQDKASSNSETSSTFSLSDSDRTTLLQIARKSIAGFLADRTIPDFDVPDNLRQPGAAFVTLEREGHLRGCIGHTVAEEPLYRTVAVCAVQAAVSDYRFQQVQAGELDDLDIEISVLTPLERVESLEEIEVGRDGLMIELGDNRGLLLPQVATDYDWNRTEFLEHTCRKAGLPTDAYKSAEAVIYRYQALIFGEKSTQ